MDVISCRGAKICSPFVTSDDSIYYVSAETGEVFQFHPPCEHVPIVFSGGEPFGAQFDHKGRLHLADCAHAAILRVDDDAQPGVMVKTYEERPFRGPNSIAFAQDGSLFFTDSGPMGETTLEKPQGSVFCITSSPVGGQVLRPLLTECLAHPWGIAVSPKNGALFVAETMQNRIVRLHQRPSNVYHASVFYQFTGGMGPSGIACGADGTLYVGHYDFSGVDGKIFVIGSDGILKRTFEIPGSEITGLCLSHDESYVLVTEASTNTIHKLVLH
ncbi:Predicted alkaloid synthase/Surface mucin Hemomucin [Plasmopara halstedii]|uniref:Predicted alkaloid synthase/Surface mucin Hemomucin n=1 Tax=Plasmopara halstedii TaxID=4781 RepID=A0A0P1AIJ3_PLAHL|nr:Predicted alkaloid synthase/Surface mucin Hemomucin [Plasmopara halstedii]CEG40832.1 Predicted alkaloid synthase/Surface mucin Hemomucin [Plasmopara halstedii]|eukprot:XP_024577201.1 Predicted alkaloid synthase/Surface mucin Hemomucin [Plasmopara halstedii]